MLTVASAHNANWTASVPVTFDNYDPATNQTTASVQVRAACPGAETRRLRAAPPAHATRGTEGQTGAASAPPLTLSLACSMRTSGPGGPAARRPGPACAGAARTRRAAFRRARGRRRAGGGRADGAGQQHLRPVVAAGLRAAAAVRLHVHVRARQRHGQQHRAAHAGPAQDRARARGPVRRVQPEPELGDHVLPRQRRPHLRQGRAP